MITLILLAGTIAAICLPMWIVIQVVAHWHPKSLPSWTDAGLRRGRGAQSAKPGRQ